MTFIALWSSKISFWVYATRHAAPHREGDKNNKIHFHKYFTSSYLRLFTLFVTCSALATSNSLFCFQLNKCLQKHVRIPLAPRWNAKWPQRRSIFGVFRKSIICIQCLTQVERMICLFFFSSSFFGNWNESSLLLLFNFNNFFFFIHLLLLKSVMNIYDFSALCLFLEKKKKGRHMAQ